MAVRTTSGTVLAVLALTGCAGEQFSLGSSAPSPPTSASMVGRWFLTTPNSPSCGLEFNGVAGARAGSVTPDGGCPGNFYTSRHWAMEGDTLTITNGENLPLAQLRSAGTHFEGRSAGGSAVTLSR